jgi:hypothetical protein
MKTLANILTMIFILSWSGLTADAGGLETGATVLQGRTINGTEVKATVRTQPYSTSAPFGRSLLWWGAPENGRPTKMIVALEVQIGAEQVPVPVSAIMGLANPTRASLRRGEGDIEIVIKGGDAATSYDAVLVFRDGYLRRRRVVLGEFPKESWEETTYSYNFSAR